MSRFSRLLKAGATTLAVVAAAAGTATAQGPGTSTGRDMLQDLQTPGAVRTYTQYCGRFRPLQFCESMEGTNFSVSPREGLQVAVNRDADGRWSVGGGVELTVPGIGMGGTASYTGYVGSGNQEVCAGPTFGLDPVFSVSPQRCATLDRDRASEIQGAIAYGQMIAASRAQSQAVAAPSVNVPPAGYGSGQTGGTRLGFDENARRQIAQYAYNPPAGLVGNVMPVSNPTPASTISAPAAAPAGSGMTQDQFRASVDQSMQQFRQASAQFGQSQATAPAAPMPASQPSGGRLMFDENAPRNANAAQSSQIYAPRNGYDSQGYRQDAPRNQYDAQGYRTDPSSSPRPQYDSQGYRQDASRNQYDAQGYRTDPSSSPRPQYDGQGYRQDSPRNQYDAQGYRIAPSSSPRPQYDGQGYRQDASSIAPSVPTVSPRAVGTQSRTAALHID